MTYRFQPLDEATARVLLAWHYESPYDFYNVPPEAVDEVVNEVLDPDYAYHTVWEGDTMIAFCCFGVDAQVPGGDYHTVALDIGFGMRPDLTGHGLGVEIVGAILDFARRRYHPRAFRATIAAFNQRSQRVCQKLGFHQVQRFSRVEDDMKFVIMGREEH